MNTKRVVVVAQAVALMSWGALATIVPANSWADDSTPGSVRTRSIDDIHADQMRNWGAKSSGTFGADVRTRSTEDAHADLMRDWNAKPSGTYGPNAQTRSTNDAYNDLVRADFIGGRPAPVDSGAVAATK